MLQQVSCRRLIALLATALLITGGGWWRSHQEGAALTHVALHRTFWIFRECLHVRGLEIEGLQEAAAGRRQLGDLPRLTIIVCAPALDILAQADAPHRADLWDRAKLLFRTDNLHLDVLATRPDAVDDLAAIRKQYQALYDKVRSWRPDQPLAGFLDEHERTLTQMILDLTR